MKKILAITLILLLPGMSILIPGSEAKKSIKHVAFEFNETCEILISLNDTDTCSNPDFIKTLYPETKFTPSFQKFFDESDKTEKTYYKTRKTISTHKLSCIRENYCDVFESTPNQNVFFWYNPDYILRQYLDVIITIQPNILHKNIATTENPINNTGATRKLTLNVNQISIQNCKNVIYDPYIIWKELGFIIFYTVNDCQTPWQLGNLANNYTKSLEKHELDLTTSPNFQYNEELKVMKERCKLKC